MRQTLMALALLSSSALAQAPAMAVKIKLWRLDCGVLDENRAKKFDWQKVPIPTPCFLVGHGDRYMLWDAGITARAIGANHPVAKLDRTISDQLKLIGVKPEQVEFVGISHYHGDHTGQATQFPKATLLMGANDFNAYKATPAPGGASADHVRPWLDGKAKAQLLAEDHDVFGDGTVKMLQTPGHTPGHTALLVKLASGPVILSGDLWFTHDDAIRGTMPDFNTSRAETLASRERIARMAEVLDAVVIMHHEPADSAKLPAFPEAAE